ncbi:MAG: GTPase Era [Terriglobales bacterium]
MSAPPPPSPPLHSGFITLLGRPNTGKSTLLNALVGEPVAAVTPHPQTTRTHLLGILNRPQGQIVLVDTPGVHRGRGSLSRQMLHSVHAGLEGRDLALLLADVTRRLGAEDELALSFVRDPAAPPTFLLLNKIDRLPTPGAILPIIAAWHQKAPFAQVLPISARRGDNLHRLLDLIWPLLPLGKPFFPPEQHSGQPEQFLISEIIREQAMLLTGEEVPHTLAVRIEADESRPRRHAPLRVIHAALYCERPGQKAILIGNKGAMIRAIGTAARQKLEAVLSTPVFLQLQILVRPAWRDDPHFLAALDFRNNRG